LVVWTRQLASLVGAGLPLERALSALSDEAPTPAQRDLVAQVRAEVNAGAPLAQALAQHPREFDNLYTAVIEAGEQSGRLGAVLLQLAKDQESAHAMRSKLLAASLYPAIVSGVALLIVLFLLAYVVPQVAQVFTSSQRSLPALTVAMRQRNSAQSVAGQPSPRKSVVVLAAGDEPHVSTYSVAPTGGTVPRRRPTHLRSP
jgi:general secretion pathway protein F